MIHQIIIVLPEANFVNRAWSVRETPLSVIGLTPSMAVVTRLKEGDELSVSIIGPNADLMRQLEAAIDAVANPLNIVPSYSWHHSPDLMTGKGMENLSMDLILDIIDKGELCVDLTYATPVHQACIMPVLDFIQRYKKDVNINHILVGEQDTTHLLYLSGVISGVGPDGGDPDQAYTRLSKLLSL